MAKTPQPALGAYVIVDSQVDPGAFEFAPRDATTPIPKEQKKVIAAATEHYARVLDAVDDLTEQNAWLADLKKIVSLGAAQANPDPATALKQIKDRNSELDKRLRSFLTPGLNGLLKLCGIVFGLSVAIAAAGRLVPSELAPKIDLITVSNYAVAVAASMLALMLQNTVAVKNVTAKTFLELKGDLATPRTDVLACLVTCIIVVTLLATGAVAINIKGLETKEVTSSAYVAVVVGVICGLSARRLGPMLIALAGKLAGRIR
jgi:hypothetical protein